MAQVKQEAEEDTWWRTQSYPAPSHTYMRRCEDLLARDIKTELRCGLFSEL